MIKVRVLLAILLTAALVGACSSPDCIASCAPSAVEVRWRGQDVSEGAVNQLCINGDCSRVSAVEVPDGSGDRLVRRDFFSDAVVAVQLVIDIPTTGASSSVDGSGKFVRSSRCTCAHLAFRFSDGRLSPLG